MAPSQAMTDIAHLLRPGHLQQLANILDDPEASDNDRFVALQLLKNANVAAGRILPGCQASTARTPPPPPLTPPLRCCARQDTGTAIVMGKRGHHVWTDGSDEACLARGVYDTYTATNLRYSQARSHRLLVLLFAVTLSRADTWQVAPIDMYKEANTKTNLPAQIEISAVLDPM